MTDNPQPETSLSDEIRNLGKALGDFFKSAWARQERQELQHNLEAGLKEMGDSIGQAAQNFEQSQTGQKVKAELQDFAQRVESGEVQAKVHTELLSALRKVNSELQKATEQMNTRSESGTAGKSASTEPSTGESQDTGSQ